MKLARTKPWRVVVIIGLALGVTAAAAGCGSGANSAAVTSGIRDAGEEPTVADADGGSYTDGSSPSGSYAEGSPSDGPDTDSSSADTLYPDVVDVVAKQSADGTWDFAVTLSSPYDSPERYADAWRVLDPDGAELGVRELTHDHATEQPFTRSLSGVVVPDEVTEVTVEGRDQRNGWGGATKTITLTGRE